MDKPTTTGPSSAPIGGIGYPLKALKVTSDRCLYRTCCRYMYNQCVSYLLALVSIKGSTS